MQNPELIFVAGCNASGKSTFIRTRLNELFNFEIIMTDVYKFRTKQIFEAALNQKKDILIERFLMMSHSKAWLTRQDSPDINLPLLYFFG